jgi:hypothetical protein
MSKTNNMKEVMGTPRSSENTLDKLIVHAARRKLFPSAAIGSGIAIGLFGFKAKCHDTGCDTFIYINLEGHDLRQISSCTYWYSNNYTHNKHSVEHGLWDDELLKTRQILLDKVVDDREAERHEAECRKKLSIDAAAEESKAFGMEFLNALSIKTVNDLKSD